VAGKQPPKKQSKSPAAPDQPAGANVFHTLADYLSTVTGKSDPKDKSKLVLPSAPVIVGMGEDGEPMLRVPGVFSTRCETLDAAIGIGGVPQSRLTVITGGEGAGKTTICGNLCRSAQEQDGIPIYIDNEFKVDLDYFQDKLGVDVSKMLVTQPSTIEDSFQILNELLMKVFRDYPGRPVLGILDSLNATKSEHEYEENGQADFGKANQAGLGSGARYQSANLPKLLRQINQKPVALVFISQPRDNIGTPGRNLVAGGNAPKFYAALAIELYRKGFWEEAGKKIGNVIIGKCFKNQVAKPFAEAEIPMRFGFGVDYNKSLLDQAVKQLLVDFSGSWYSMESDDPANPIKWQGLKGWHGLTETRPELLEYLRDKVREGYRRYTK